MSRSCAVSTLRTATAIAEFDALAQLRLLQLVSPALPVGAFAFSHGLEYAVQAGWVDDADALQAWLEGVLAGSIAGVDAPLLLRCHRAAAAGDPIALAHWNTELLAWRETAELYLADVAVGGALVRLLGQLPQTRPLLPTGAISWTCAFAAAAVALAIPARSALLAYLWSFAENQVTAALKLMPLGQSAGQRILLEAATAIPALAVRAESIGDDAIGGGAPGLAMASAWHETQYSRLFRA
jgi:urease accessory protein